MNPLRPMSVDEGIAEWRDRDDPPFVSTPAPALNRAIGGGWSAEQTAVVAGYTGSGKSEFGQHSAVFAARAGHPAVIVDVELGLRTSVLRRLSDASGIPWPTLRGRRLLSAVEHAHLEAAIESLRALPLRFVCPVSGTPLGVVKEAVSAAFAQLPKGRTPFVLLDSGQRLAAGASGATQREQNQAFMWWASSLARETGAAVLIVSEQKRSLEGKVPTAESALTSAAESRAFEFVADLVLTLVPGDRPDQQAACDASDHGERRVRLLVAKNRNGSVGYLPEDLVFTRPCWGMRAETAGGSLRRAIRDAQLAGLKSGDEIAKAIGRRKKDVLDELKRMKGATESVPASGTATTVPGLGTVQPESEPS